MNKSDSYSETITKLADEWTIYFFKMNKEKKWIDNMKTIFTVDSVESFWGTLSHLKPVYEMSYGCDYYFFRKHIAPMWENEFNKNGGTWVISSHKSKRHSELDVIWIEVLMFLIGETMEEDSNEICGAAVNIRGNYDKITVWTANSSNDESNKRIGLRLKSLLNLNRTIEYIPHAENINKTNFAVKPKLIV